MIDCQGVRSETLIEWRHLVTPTPDSKPGGGGQLFVLVRPRFYLNLLHSYASITEPRSRSSPTVKVTSS